MNKGKAGSHLIAALMCAIFASNAPAADVTYTTHIKPIFDQKCAGCHGSGAPEGADFKKDKDKFKAMSKGPKMDGYAHLIGFIVWPDSGAIMRRLDDGKNTKDGKPGNMYNHLGSTDGERQKNLLLFKEWIGNWNLKRWADVTKEELNGLRVAF